MFGFVQDTQLSMEQSQRSLHDPDTQEVIPEETAGPVDWIKATVRAGYPEKEKCPTPPMNAKWNTPGDAVPSPCNFNVPGSLAGRMK